MRLFEVSTALEHYSTALTLLWDGAVTAVHDSSVHLYLQVGKSYELQFRQPQALRIYEELLTLAADQGNREMELAALAACCLVLPPPFEIQNVPLACELAQRAAVLAKSLVDLEAQARIELSLARIAQLSDKLVLLNLRHWLPVILHLRARAELATGSEDDAYRSLSEALAVADEMGTHCEIWSVCRQLARLAHARGETLRADQLQARALAEVELIAAHAGTDALHEAFLSREDVRRVMG